MRKLALSALEQFDLRVARLRLVNHGFNSTFKVLSETGDTYALRLNLNSRKSPEQVLAEVEWIDEIRSKGIVNVAKPVRTKTGAKLALVDSGQGSTSVAVLMSWLPGRVMDEPPLKQVFAMGQAMAHLHSSGQRWRPSAEASLLRIDDIFMGLENNIFTDARPTDELKALVERVLETCGTVFEALASRFQVQPIHADLHPGNVIWDHGQVSVIDFDDMGVGFIAQDLAIARYYLRGEGKREERFLEGYESVAELPQLEPHEIEALIASRNIMLLSDLLVTKNSNLQELVPNYLERTKGNLERYLESGQFTFPD